MRKNPGKDEEEQKEILYQKTQMHRDRIFRKLREQGCRITRQRRMLLDIILEGDCSCCKEIYYKASALDPGIGTATVYRMVNALEQIGAISRRNMYRISGDGDDRENACRVELSDHTVRIFSSGAWMDVVKAGLKEQGYIEDQDVESVELTSQVRDSI